jgi:hypothetical protein
VFEIEAGDDFVLQSQIIINSAPSVGFYVGTGAPSITGVVIETW